MAAMALTARVRARVRAAPANVPTMMRRRDADEATGTCTVAAVMCWISFVSMLPMLVLYDRI